MEKSGIKIIFKKYRRPITCLRFLLLYFIFLFIAKHSSVYESGLIPKNLFTTVIAVGLILYRFLVLCFVPVIAILWIFELIFARMKINSQG